MVRLPRLQRKGSARHQPLQSALWARSCVRGRSAPSTGAQLGLSCSAATDTASPTLPALATTPYWVSTTAATA